MRISVHRADLGGCGQYRLGFAAQHLADAGYPVSIDTPPIRITYDQRFHGPNPPPWVRILDADADTDCVVVQRPLHRQYLDIIPMLREKGIRVVVELDDCFDRIHRENSAFRAAEPHWLSDEELAERESRYGEQNVKVHDGTWHYCPDITSASHRENIHASLRLADHLVVSTPALAAHYGKSIRSVSIVPNFVPERYLLFGERHLEPGLLRVGWTGSTESHPRDLHEIGSGLANVRGRYQFLVVGTGKGVGEALGRPVDGYTGWVHLDRYPEAYSQLDIAICPLEKSRFNNCKSALKPLEAAACGVIPVMSPSPEYVALNRMGVGLIARTPAEWTRHIELLLGSPIQRGSLRRRGLDVARSLTVEGNSGRFLQAWQGSGRPDTPVVADQEAMAST